MKISLSDIQAQIRYIKSLPGNVEFYLEKRLDSYAVYLCRNGKEMHLFLGTKKEVWYFLEGVTVGIEVQNT